MLLRAASRGRQAGSAAHGAVEHASHLGADPSRGNKCAAQAVQPPGEGTCRREREPVGRAGATSPRTFHRGVGHELGAGGEIVKRRLDEHERAREILRVVLCVRRLPKRASGIAQTPSGSTQRRLVGGVPAGLEW